MRRSVASLTTVSLALLPSIARAQETVAATGAMPNTVLYIILALVFGSAIVGILTIRNVLMRPGGSWSLTDALSEEVEFFGLAPQPAAARANAENAAAAVAGAAVGAPVGAAAGDTTTAVIVQPPPEKVTRMVASSSRLIALLGLIGILALFLGFGLVLIWQVARGAAVKEAIDSISDYLLYGVVMFAPYLVNKFSSVFSTFSK